jgi:uncharacterized protein
LRYFNLMNIWAISDLHLSFAHPDRRERYAARWRDHAEKIEKNWREVVGAGDLVLVPGDISMARNHRDVQLDLAWLDRLPGTKVLSAGNHDRWWNDVESVRPMLRRSMFAVGGDAVFTHGVVVCGAMGTPVPTDPPDPDLQPAFHRELGALENAIARAIELRSTAARPVYLLWHYPPFDAHARPGPCVERFEQAGVTACLYGHMHIEGQWLRAVQGTIHGVRYHCVAADAIGFRPLRIASR